jgi:hypothetical protein
MLLGEKECKKEEHVIYLQRSQNSRLDIGFNIVETDRWIRR